MKRLTGASGRYFLKDSVRLETDFSQTGRSRGLPAPPAEKPCDPAKPRIALVPHGSWRSVSAVDLVTAIGARRSVRRYLAQPLALDELAFLLWATQGVRKSFGPSDVLRTVPSAGARHPFETYVCALNVEGLDPGIYRYLAVENELCLEARMPQRELRRRIEEAALGQGFVGSGAATFVWAALPWRMEWRYGAAAYRVIALDAGHVCQNLYLACAAVGAGTCAIAAYDQGLVDGLLGVDGSEEFAVYLAPVGKVAKAPPAD